MQCVTACILLLALCGPVLVNSKKVVFVVPHQIRRSPALPHTQLIHQPSYHSKRSYYPTGTKRPYDSTSVYYGKSKPYGYDKRKVPHGGDDFDQGHESIRHIAIPHGKGISHGISFGRGYIPYSKIKSDFTRIHPSPESRPDLSYHLQSSSGPTATEALYTEPSSSQFSPSSFSPSDYNYSERKAINDQINLSQEKYMNFHTVDSAIDPTNAVNYGISKSGDNFKPSIVLQKTAATNQRNHNLVPLNTNGKGIVISDSLLLDDYHKKVEEFTNSWPKVVGLNSGLTNTQVTPSLFIGGHGVPVAQGRQSYAVHEDVQEPPPNFHGVVTSPFQIGQTTKNVDVSSLISVQG